MESTPLVAAGVMYVTTGNSTVYALDAKSGATKRKYVPGAMMQASPGAMMPASPGATMPAVSPSP